MDSDVYSFCIKSYELAISTTVGSCNTGVELDMKSANAPLERSIDDNVLESDQRDFLGNIESLRMTASSRINSHTDLNRIDETRGNITVEEGDLLVNEKNIDRQTYAHHNYC